MPDETKNLLTVQASSMCTTTSLCLISFLFGAVLVIGVQTLSAWAADQYYTKPLVPVVTQVPVIQIPTSSNKNLVLPEPEASVTYRQLPSESITPELILKALEERGDLCNDAPYQKPGIYTLGAFNYYDLTAALEVIEEIHPESGEILSTCNYLTFTYDFWGDVVKVSGVIYEQEVDGIFSRSLKLDEESKKLLSNIPYGIGTSLPTEWFDGLETLTNGTPIKVVIYTLHTVTPFNKGGSPVSMSGKIVEPTDKD